MVLGSVPWLDIQTQASEPLDYSIISAKGTQKAVTRSRVTKTLTQDAQLYKPQKFAAGTIWTPRTYTAPTSLCPDERKHKIGGAVLVWNQYSHKTLFVPPPMPPFFPCICYLPWSTISRKAQASKLLVTALGTHSKQMKGIRQHDSATWHTVEAVHSAFWFPQWKFTSPLFSGCPLTNPFSISRMDFFSPA